MSERRAFCVARVVLDVFLASLGAIGIYLFKLFGSKFLHKSGFHCSDETLAYPYKPSTIPSAINGSVGVIVPALIIVADHFVKAKRIFIRLDKAVVVKTLGKIFPVLIVFLAGTIGNWTIFDCVVCSDDAVGTVLFELALSFRFFLHIIVHFLSFPPLLLFLLRFITTTTTISSSTTTIS